MSLEGWAKVARIVAPVLLSVIADLARIVLYWFLGGIGATLLALFWRYQRVVESSSRAAIEEQRATIKLLEVTIEGKDAAIDRLRQEVALVREKRELLDAFDVLIKERQKQFVQLRGVRASPDAVRIADSSPRFMAEPDRRVQGEYRSIDALLIGMGLLV